MEEQQSRFGNWPTEMKIGIGVGALVLAVIIFLLFFPIVIIGAGERGVVFSNVTGIEDRVLGEGVHFRIPLIQSVHALSIKVQKNDVKAEAASKDLQTVSTDIVVNWHLDASKVNKIYQNIGDEKAVLDRIINPAVNEVVKAATAQKTAEEVLTKRAELKADIDTLLQNRLSTYGVILDDVSIVDVNFSPEFNAAIEQKTVSAQLALKAENDLRRIEVEAQQTIASAKAQAESIKIQAEALANNQRLVDWETVKKWNGVLPQIVTGNSGMLLNLPALAK